MTTERKGEQRRTVSQLGPTDPERPSANVIANREERIERENEQSSGRTEIGRKTGTVLPVDPLEAVVMMQDLEENQ